MTQQAVTRDDWLSVDPDAITPPKRYKIGELSAFTGLSRQTLHNYTRWGLIRAVAWTRGGHRLFDEGVFGRLARIMQWRSRLTVDEMKRRLDGSGAREDERSDG